METFKQYLKEKFDPYVEDPFSKISGHTLVFFDTETGGFDQHVDQITEIAAIAVDGDTLKEIGQFHEYIKLHQNVNPDILKMTNYDKSKGKLSEEVVLGQFIDFVMQQNNPILVAHNASFDMKMVMTKLGDNRPPRIKVYDTLMFARFLLLPTLEALSQQGNEKATKAADALTRRTKTGKLVISKNDNRMVAVTLGNLGNAFNIDMKDWHSALADTKVLVDIFKHMKNYYNEDILQDPHFKKAFTHAHKMNQFSKQYKRKRK